VVREEVAQQGVKTCTYWTAFEGTPISSVRADTRPPDIGRAEMNTGAAQPRRRSEPLRAGWNCQFGCGERGRHRLAAEGDTREWPLVAGRFRRLISFGTASAHYSLDPVPTTISGSHHERGHTVTLGTFQSGSVGRSTRSGRVLRRVRGRWRDRRTDHCLPAGTGGKTNGSSSSMPSQLSRRAKPSARLPTSRGISTTRSRTSRPSVEITWRRSRRPVTRLPST
jgi:hypothetical protein